MGSLDTDRKPLRSMQLQGRRWSKRFVAFQVLHKKLERTVKQNLQTEDGKSGEKNTWQRHRRPLKKHLPTERKPRGQYSIRSTRSRPTKALPPSGATSPS